MAEHADLKRRMAERKAERDNDERLAVAKKRRLMEGLRAKEEKAERVAKEKQNEEADLAAPTPTPTPTETTQPTPTPEPTQPYSRPTKLTPSQYRERAVKSLLLQAGFFDQHNVPHVIASDTEYYLASSEELPKEDIADQKAALEGMGQLDIAGLQKVIHLRTIETINLGNRTASGQQKTAEEMAEDLLNFHKELAVAEEAQLQEEAIGAEEYVAMQKEEDAHAVAESLSRIDRYEKKEGILVKCDRSRFRPLCTFIFFSICRTCHLFTMHRSCVPRCTNIKLQFHTFSTFFFVSPGVQTKTRSFLSVSALRPRGRFVLSTSPFPSPFYRMREKLSSLKQTSTADNANKEDSSSSSSDSSDAEENMLTNWR